MTDDNNDETTAAIFDLARNRALDEQVAHPGREKRKLPKRFYRKAEAGPHEGGFAILLDGRIVRTPSKQPLAVPVPALAEALAAEWDAQQDEIDPRSMRLTKLANTAIDGVASRREAVADDLCAYAQTDLLAYRAAEPDRLVAAQAAAWDPVLDWAYDTFGARLILSEGVMHVTQPPLAVQALSDAVRGVHDPFRLAALHTLTTLTGSLILALALLHGQLSPEQAWAAAHVDETYQADVWGRDEEAEARLAARRSEFEAAARTIATLA